MTQSIKTPIERLADGVEIYLGDCREVLPIIGDIEIGAVIADPPYGTTQCAWDSVIPLDQMWEALSLVAPKGVPILIFGTEPFSSQLRLSNIKQFKYDWIWNKPKGTGFLNAKKQPLRGHEIVSVFCDGACPYYPQKTSGHERKKTFRAKHLQTDVYGEMSGDYHYDSTERYPRTVITFSSDTQNSSVHPTQKPVSLLEYLILTYTSPGEIVLDFTMGSGTCGVAAVKCGRKFRGIETDKNYFEIAKTRISEELSRPSLFLNQRAKIPALKSREAQT